MKVYFVRHGKSDNKGLHQTPHTELAEEGYKQAELLSERFKDLKIDLILCSSFTRTRQTAETFNKNFNIPIEYSDLLVEIRRPSEVEGKNGNDENIMNIKKTIWENWHTKGWHYSDEENIHDLKDRAGEALDLIQSKKYENILVVSHDVFIKMMYVVCIFGRNVDTHIYSDFNHHSAMSNTGVTEFDYIDDNWKLVTWNDQSHLKKNLIN